MGFGVVVWLGFPVSRGVLQYGFVGLGGDLGVFGVVVVVFVFAKLRCSGLLVSFGLVMI